MLTVRNSLEIERGRYCKSQVCQQFCENMIEDEIHFMCVCFMYSTLRNQLEQKIQMDFLGYEWLSSEEKYIYLLELSNRVTMPYIFHTQCFYSTYMYTD